MRLWRVVIHLACLILTWAVWLWLASRPFTAAFSLVVASLGALLIIPIGLGGRALLDRQPTVEAAEWVTTGVHYALAVCLGSAIVAAVRFGQSAPAWPIPVPTWLGVGVMLLSGAAWLLAILNLALKGRGSPLALALTRTVAVDWLYAWTRNPIVLSTLAFLVGLGLWLQSGLFLVWVVVIVGPAILVWLSAYEERELEIRFGQAYLDYKARTPWLWPRPPRQV